MQDMVVGFHFDEKLEKVVFIRKLKPDWQKNKLNGVGGKIEGDETPLDAMVREYEEETGVKTELFSWQYFMTMQGEDFKIFYFVAQGDISTVRSVEAEKVEVTDLKDVTLTRKDMVENLAWITGAAYDVVSDGRPKDIYVYY